MLWNWWGVASLALFFTGMVYTMVTIGNASSGSDFKNEMTKAITTVTIVNGILIVILMGMAFVSIPSDVNSIGNLKTYMIVMTHMSLFLAMISVSISSIQQLSSS